MLIGFNLIGILPKKIRYKSNWFFFCIDL